MNNVIAFFVGCLTFVVMMLLKIPVKKINRVLAEKIESDVDEAYILYKRLNGIIMLIAVMLAVVIYYFVLQWIGEEHFKLCCSLKAGVVAVAFYAVYEQFLE